MITNSVTFYNIGHNTTSAHTKSSNVTDGFKNNCIPVWLRKVIAMLLDNPDKK